MNEKDKIEAYRKRYAFFRFRMFSTIKKLVETYRETSDLDINSALLDEIEKYRTEELTFLQIKNK